MDLPVSIIEKIKLLDEKYSAMGQDLNAYLEGLLYADYITYWNYIHLDTLLSLQTPLTNIPDEEIFIMYHQITELYFKLCLHEMNQVASHSALTIELMTQRVQRVNRYFDALTHSFDIMSQGMEKEQFLKFRMSLLPASGFQSAQYRTIEIMATSFRNLMHKDFREKYEENPEVGEFGQMFEHIYWKEGATELATGKKTLTLRQFEKKYSALIIQAAIDHKGNNFWMLYKRFEIADGKDGKLKSALRELDQNVNVNWPLAHFKTAVAYLQKDPRDIAATGGTNWQKYLPPRFQRRIFYPALWSDEEKSEWGKQWVSKNVFGEG